MATQPKPVASRFRQPFLSDFHLGKAEAFQRAGINLPQKSQGQIDGFFALLQEKKIKEVFILGDLLHGPTTLETQHFLSLLQSLNHIHFHWILGNHDARSAHRFGQDIAHFKQAKNLNWNGILLCHEPQECTDSPYICGHIHPGIYLPLGAKQRARVACGMLSKNQLVLPAFGSLTGLHIQKPSTGITYYIFRNKSGTKMRIQIQLKGGYSLWHFTRNQANPLIKYNLSQ